jgi:hypothetical protein
MNHRRISLLAVLLAATLCLGSTYIVYQNQLMSAMHELAVELDKRGIKDPVAGTAVLIPGQLMRTEFDLQAYPSERIDAWREAYGPGACIEASNYLCSQHQSGSVGSQATHWEHGSGKFCVAVCSDTSPQRYAVLAWIGK